MGKGLVIRLVEEGAWECTATELLHEMNNRASPTMRESKLWPRAANMMSNEVMRLAPTLRATEGIEVTTGKTGGRRWIAIRRVEENIVQTDPSSQSDSSQIQVEDDPLAPQVAGFVPERDDGTMGDGLLHTSSNGDDDGPRKYLIALGEELGFPNIPGVIPSGVDQWQKAARYMADDDVMKTVAAVEALLAEVTT